LDELGDVPYDPVDSHPVPGGFGIVVRKLCGGDDTKALGRGGVGERFGFVGVVGLVVRVVMFAFRTF
jgi:hypothetical protein